VFVLGVDSAEDTAEVQAGADMAEAPALDVASVLAQEQAVVLEPGQVLEWGQAPAHLSIKTRTVSATTSNSDMGCINSRPLDGTQSRAIMEL
jgi:hypothetical protein